MAAADFGEEGLSCYTGVAMSAAAAVKWLVEERFELKGFYFALSASKCDGLKLEVLSATGELFIGAWDFEAQVLAGFGRRADAESRLKMMRTALSNHPSMTTTLIAAGSELKLEIKVPVADYFAVEIELCMRRAQDCESLSAWLRQVTADWKAAQRQLTDFHSDDLHSAELSKEIASLKVAMSEAASDSGAIVEELREANAKMEAEQRSAEQMLAEAKAESDRRGADLIDVRTQAAAKCRVAEQKLAEAKERIEELRETNATFERRLAAATKELTDAKSQISDARRDFSAAKKRSDARIAQLSKEISSLKSALAKAKAKSKSQNTKSKKKAKTAADRSAADDSREFKSADESDTRKKAKKKTDFRFDAVTKGGMTQLKEWQVSADGKSATAKERMAQILISPPLRSDSQLTIEVLKKESGRIGVGVVDDYSQWLNRGCMFDSDGDVHVKGYTVAQSQAFGDWHSGDRLFVTVNLSSGTVSIRAPKGEYTAKWTPTSSPIWFAVYSRFSGTKLRIIAEAKRRRRRRRRRSKA